MSSSRAEGAVRGATAIKYRTQRAINYRDRSHGGRAGALLRGEEKGAARLLAELVAENTEASWGVAEALRDDLRGEVLDEVGAQSLVLPVSRIGGLEEVRGVVRYPFFATARHAFTMSYYLGQCQALAWREWERVDNRAWIQATGLFGEELSVCS